MGAKNVQSDFYIQSFWFISIVDNIRQEGSSSSISDIKISSRMIANAWPLFAIANYQNITGNPLVSAIRKLQEIGFPESLKPYEIVEHLIRNELYRKVALDLYAKSKFESDTIYKIVDSGLLIQEYWFEHAKSTFKNLLKAFRDNIVDQINNSFPNEKIDIGQLISGKRIEIKNIDNILTKKNGHFDLLLKKEGRENIFFPRSFLWELIVTDEEYSSLKALLKDACARNVGLDKLSKEFMLYYAEWFRRECTNIQNISVHIQRSLGAENVNIQQLAEAGFESIGKGYIRINTTRKQYSLLLEGGLPINYILNNQNGDNAINGFFRRLCLKKELDERDIIDLPETVRRCDSFFKFAQAIIHALASDVDSSFPFFNNETWIRAIKEGWRQAEEERSSSPFTTQWLFDLANNQLLYEIRIHNRISDLYMTQIGLERSNNLRLSLTLSDESKILTVFQYQESRNDYYSPINNPLIIKLAEYKQIRLLLNEVEIHNESFDFDTPKIFYRNDIERFYRLGNKLNRLSSCILFSNQWQIDENNVVGDYSVQSFGDRLSYITLNPEYFLTYKEVVFIEQTPPSRQISISPEGLMYYTKFSRIRVNYDRGENCVLQQFVSGKAGLFAPWGKLELLNYEGEAVEGIIGNNDIEYRSAGNQQWGSLGDNELPLGVVFIRIFRNHIISTATRILNLGTDFLVLYQDQTENSCNINVRFKGENTIIQANNAQNQTIYHLNLLGTNIVFRPQYRGVNIYDRITNESIVQNQTIPLCNLNNYHVDIFGEEVRFSINSVDYRGCINYRGLIRANIRMSLFSTIGESVNSVLLQIPDDIVKNNGVKVQIGTLSFFIKEYTSFFTYSRDTNVISVVDQSNNCEHNGIEIIAIPIDSNRTEISLLSGSEANEVELTGAYILMPKYPIGVLPKLIYFDNNNELLLMDRTEILNQIISKFQLSTSFSDDVWHETSRYFDIVIKTNVSFSTFLHFTAISTNPIFLAKFWAFIYFKKFFGQDLTDELTRKNVKSLAGKLQDDLTFRWYWIKAQVWLEVQNGINIIPNEFDQFVDALIALCCDHDITFITVPQLAAEFPIEDIIDRFYQCDLENIYFDTEIPINLTNYGWDDEFKKFAMRPFALANGLLCEHADSVIWKQDIPSNRIKKNIIFFETKFPALFFELLEYAIRYLNNH